MQLLAFQSFLIVRVVITMKYHIIILIFFTIVESKIYSLCELSLELYLRHRISKDEIPYHICIAAEKSDFNTRDSYGREYLGLYKIGSESWCGQRNPDGLCRVKCSYLENDDLSDDVKCASMILQNYGLTTWGLINNICHKYHEQVTRCLENRINRNGFENLETTEIKLTE